MSNANLLEQLIVGLALYFEQTSKYPFPDVLQTVINALALEKRSQMPITFTGFLRLVREYPINKWYPQTSPNGIDPEAYLLEENGLSLEALEYLDRFTEQTKTSISALQYSHNLNIVVANWEFLQLKRRLEHTAIHQSELAQDEYKRLRRFIIENPYTTLDVIESVFARFGCIISESDVAKLYEEARSRAGSLRFPDASGRAMYWFCEQCGPLIASEMGLESIKATVCGNHCPRNRSGWKAVPISKEVLVLREGIHLRTHLPGIPELALYDWLFQQYEDHYPYMQEPELWPHIDAYDVHLVLGDEVWAIDFKDYKDPYQLATQLKGIGRHGDKFSQTFYVYPAYREQQRKHYAEIVRKNSDGKRRQAMILSDDAFKTRIVAKLKSMRKGK